jgi:hypothetical protein
MLPALSFARNGAQCSRKIHRLNNRYNRHVKAVYEHLIAKGRYQMAALGAAMRKITHLCFGVFRNRTPYVEIFSSTP